MSDTHAGCMNFVNALEKIPGIIAQFEERTAKLRSDVPVLEGIVAKVWGKKSELKQLKSDLTALDRKISAELAPKHDEKDGEEVKQVENQAQSSGSKESMVAEPASHGYRQQPREPLNSRIIIGGCGATPPGGFRAAGPKF